MNRSQRLHQRGLTFVELLISLSITAVAAGTAVPALGDFTQRHRLDAATQLLRTDLQHARSAAVAAGEPVRLRVQSGEGGSCYVVHTGPAQACECLEAGAARCSAGAQVLRMAQLPATEGIVLTSNSTTLTFDGGWGTVTPTGTLQLVNRRGQNLRLVVNVMGRVRQCTTTPGMPGAVGC